MSLKQVPPKDDNAGPKADPKQEQKHDPKHDQPGPKVGQKQDQNHDPMHDLTLNQKQQNNKQSNKQDDKPKNKQDQKRDPKHDPKPEKDNKQDPKHGPQHEPKQDPTRMGATADSKPGQKKALKSKRGLCWPVENKKDRVQLFIQPGSKVSWLYNGSPDETPESDALEFVPMQWNHVDIEELQQKVKKAKAGTLIGFNEPELKDQSNMTAEHAAKEWIRGIEPLRKAGTRCGSPVISSAPQGVTWLQDFMRRIGQGGSDVDFCHHQLDPKQPIWITEYASTNWNKENPLPREHVENFAKESAKYLDTLDWVERYAWFGPMRDAGTVGKWARMLNDEGKLTPLGKAYRDE